MIIRKELSHATFAYISLAGRKWIVDLDCNQQSHPGKDITVNRGEVSAGRSEVPWEDVSPSLYLNLAAWLWQVEAAFLLSSKLSPTSFLLFIFYVYGCFTRLYACVRVPGWNWSCKLL